jgi:hypothetical protein
MKSMLLALLFLVLVASSSHAQLATLPPVDEARRDTSLVRFRAQLIRALQQHDTAYLISIVSPDVCNGFGGDPGLDGFRLYWFGEGNPKMDELREALKLGGTLSQDSTYSVPYYARFPSQFDAFANALVLGQRVHARGRPSRQSPIVATLTYAIVGLPEGWEAHPDQDEQSNLQWLHVGLGEGRLAFIVERYVRSPLGLRVSFMKRNGHWILTGWAEGD